MRTEFVGAICAALLLSACSPEDTDATVSREIVPVSTEVPAGAYTLEKSHASLIFRVNHLGFSMYTARFTRFDAKLQFDPTNPAGSRVSATVDVRSLQTDFPNPETLDFNAELTGPGWLDAGQYPEMTFRSTDVTLTGPNTARVTGDFTLHGVTRPVILETTFNGGYRGHPMDPNARIGFSARATLKRSEFGIAFGVPEPGSTLGVGDDVEIIIEAEFTGPPMPAGEAE